MSNAFLRIDHLNAVLAHNRTRILRDVSIDVSKGEVHGLVGESGAGKSMLGKAVLGVLPRAIEIVGGHIVLGGTDLASLSSAERRTYVGAKAALIPQDPLTALNPSRRIGPQVMDRLTHGLGWKKARARAKSLEMLEEVQIRDPARVMHSYPHELSGGMRQRVLIAAAFVSEPELIVADEPTTALDVTVQKQILKMIREMQARHGTTMLFVTHDLGVVARICQNVTVLFSGMVVERTDTRTLLSTPSHPYSQALLDATPRYNRPDIPFCAVPDAVIAAARADIETLDRQWTNRHG